MPPGIGYVDPMTGQWSPDPPQDPAGLQPNQELFPQEQPPAAPEVPTVGEPQQAGLGQLATGLQNMGQQVAQPFQQAHQQFEEVVRPVQQVTSLETKAPRGSEAAIQDFSDRSLQAGQMASQKQYAADQAAARAEATLASERERAEATHLQETSKLLDERNKVLGAKQTELFKLGEEIKNTKIDPWKNKSTGQRIAAIGGAILGGLLIPTLGRNPAMEMMDRMMEQEIDLQKTELGAKKDALSAGFNLYGLMRQHYGDELAAKDATKAAMINQAVAGFDKKMAGVKNEQALARHLDFRSQLLNTAAQLEQQAMGRELQREATAWERQKHRESMSFSWSQLGEQRRHNMAMENQQELELKARAEAEKTKAAGKDLRVYGVKFKTKDAQGKDVEQDFIQAKTDGSYDKLQEIVNSGTNQIGLLRDIKSLGTEGNLINDAEKAMADAAWADIRLDKQALVKGIPSDKDQRIIDLSMGTKTPQEVFTLLNKEERLKVINYLEDRVRRDINTRLKTVSGKGVSWDPEVNSLTEPSLPQEPDTPDEIRQRMKMASHTPVSTPVTNKRSEVSSPFLDTARQALADKDPESLRKTRAAVAAEAFRLTGGGLAQADPNQLKLSVAYGKLVSEIDAEIKKQEYNRQVEGLRSRRGRGGLAK